ncbi:DUF1330 domain-containing protein [Acidisoma cellulosilytica]|uniref:DUF1330 domain-containing protein n=1 Tax=Acidisoma cellulosilyticum TaxID=2802395 RepID=A0A964E538_9PROT|nr:DUF1330 domain-containing protein [Acidisoma cellulosilyticum]MCB8882104.1 DUF1330 domain-containing protein [Acidisoma cellulosilyticum]
MTSHPQDLSAAREETSATQPATEPKAYVLAQITVDDAAAYAASGYMSMVEAAVAAFGGRYVIRGGAPEALEGEPGRERTVLLEFPSREAARAWHGSDLYAPAITLRQSLSTGRMTLLDAYEG